MDIIYKKIGDHTIKFTFNQKKVADFIMEQFCDLTSNITEQDMEIAIVLGFGSPFSDYNVYISKENGKTIFRRSDYLIVADIDYRSATIFVNNELALKHALMNLYSSYITYHNWGLLIHSSCVIQDGRAHIFAGQSGAGKSTAARLSQPRDLLSDEATIARITPNEIKVFNSPFRSEINTTGNKECAPLASIQILRQSPQNNQVDLRKADAFIRLMDKIFYWSHNPEETKKIMGLLKMLVDRVPVYELYFRKDDTFWELIS
jgi:hypothetical protein